MSVKKDGQLYLTGPMTGIPEHNQPRFNDVAAKLRAGGFDVFNPAETDDGDTTKPREYYMRIDLGAVMRCAGVVVMEGWNESQGANTEVMVAWQCSIPVYRYSDLTSNDEDTGLPRPFSLDPLDSTAPQLPYSTEPTPQFDSICKEADAIVNGARRSAYGHPLDDYTKVAGMLNALFSERMGGKQIFNPEDVPLFFICAKMAREVHFGKRDNRLDIAGYAQVTDMISTERTKRGLEKNSGQKKEGGV